MKRLIPHWRKMTWTLGTIALATVLVGTAQASAGWHVVKSRSASGQFAVTAITATVNRPQGIAVRLRGPVSTGTAVIACSRNFSVTSNSRSYKRAGLYVLPMMRRASSCDVVASVGGSGRVTVQILKRG